MAKGKKFVGAKSANDKYIIAALLGILVVLVFVFINLFSEFMMTEGFNFGFKKEVEHFEVSFEGDFYEAEVQSIINCIITEDMDDYEKFKVIHDFVAFYLDYDYDALGDLELAKIRNDAETCLDTGWAVCGGYASLYKDLCDAAGLMCHYISGKADFLDFDGIGHAWNLVMLDGTLYHVDVCWDDTCSPTQGTIYDWFMQGNGYVTNDFRSWEGSYVISTESYPITRSKVTPYTFEIVY